LTPPSRLVSNYVDAFRMIRIYSSYSVHVHIKPLDAINVNKYSLV